MTGTPFKALLLLGWLVAALSASPRFDPTCSRLPAGTEITELRTPTSRTYSNGDGTFTAEIAPMGAGGADSQDTCRPTSTGWVYYFYVQYYPYHYYARYGPEMRFRDGNWYGAAYAKFDLASIPDSSKVVSVQWRFFQYAYTSPETAMVMYTDLDPDSASNVDLLFAIRFSGALLAAGRYSYTGWVTQELSMQGVNIVQDRLQEDWVTLGIKPGNDLDGGGGEAYGMRDDSLQTCLHIVYSTSGTCEPRAANLPRPELVVAPNPATGRYVTARCAIPKGKVVKLTLRNALGELVKSYSLSPSGRTRLDLRGLASGVYMATLETGTQSLTRKLIITSR